MMAIEHDADPQALQRAAAAINDLLVKHGYPRDHVDSWWNSVYSGLGGRTPAQAWRDGDHDLVDRVIRRDYAATERSVTELVADPEAMEFISRKIVELDEIYGVP
jgi:hypothetical protein